MDRYKKLTVNTLILTIGTVGSKIITFLMLPFYTNVLSTAQYGTVDLLIQTGSFLVPIFTIGIASSITRFGLDNEYKKKMCSPPDWPAMVLASSYACFCL